MNSNEITIAAAAAAAAAANLVEVVNDGTPAPAPAPAANIDNVLVHLASGIVTAGYLRSLKGSGPCVRFRTQTGWSRNRSRIYGVSADGRKVRVAYFKAHKRWQAASEIRLDR